MLKNRTGLKAVTWGLRSALEDRQSDAWVARELARHFGLAHEYYEMDLSNEAVEKVLDRFLVAGEGRTDHISGYMDGFAVWKRLHESGCQGVLRGDEAFGWRPVTTRSGVLHCIGITRLSDYGNLQLSEIPGLHEQILPGPFQQSEKESLSQWRDRLYQIFRAPYILAALNDLKCAYVEILNPLLARAVIDRVRRLPDLCRTDKRLFKNIVDHGNHSLAYAENPAIEAQVSILRNSTLIDLVLRELNGSQARLVFPESVLSDLAVNVSRVASSRSAARSNSGRFKSLLKRILPIRVVAIIKACLSQNHGNFTAVKIDANRLAFRAYIISRMTSLLGQDAKLLNHP
jgi:hypothetical protein